MLRNLCMGAALALTGGTVSAQDLVYTPLNPSFGGQTLNSTHLLAIASAQRDATARDANIDFGGGFSGGDSSSPSDADLFVRQLEGRLLSALAGQVTEAIFGTDVDDNGSVTFGTTQVEYRRTLDSIALTITDSVNGTTTEIVVPQLVTTDSGN